MFLDQRKDRRTVWIRLIDHLGESSCKPVDRGPDGRIRAYVGLSGVIEFERQQRKFIEIVLIVNPLCLSTCSVAIS